MSHLSRSSLITKISYLQNFYFTICLIFICTGYISNASSNASPCIKAISQVDPAERAHLEDLTLNTPPPDMLKFPVEYRLHLEHQRAIMTKRSKDFFDEAHTAIAGKIFENNQNGNSGRYLGGITINESTIISFLDYVIKDQPGKPIILLDSSHFRIADGIPHFSESDIDRIKKGLLPKSITVNKETFSLSSATRVYALVETSQMPVLPEHIHPGSIINFIPSRSSVYHFPSRWNDDSSLDAASFHYVYDHVLPIARLHVADQTKILEIENLLAIQNKTLIPKLEQEKAGRGFSLDRTFDRAKWQEFQERDHIYSLEIPHETHAAILHGMSNWKYAENYNRYPQFIGKLWSTLTLNNNYFKAYDPTMAVKTPDGKMIYFKKSELVRIDGFPQADEEARH